MEGTTGPWFYHSNVSLTLLSHDLLAPLPRLKLWTDGLSKQRVLYWTLALLPMRLNCPFYRTQPTKFRHDKLFSANGTAIHLGGTATLQVTAGDKASPVSLAVPRNSVSPVNLVHPWCRSTVLVLDDGSVLKLVHTPQSPNTTELFETEPP